MIALGDTPYTWSFVLCEWIPDLLDCISCFKMRSIRISLHSNQGIPCYQKRSNVEHLRKLAAGLMEALFSQSDSPTDHQVPVSVSLFP